MACHMRDHTIPFPDKRLQFQFMDTNLEHVKKGNRDRCKLMLYGGHIGFLACHMTYIYEQYTK